MIWISTVGRAKGCNYVHQARRWWLLGYRSINASNITRLSSSRRTCSNSIMVSQILPNFRNDLAYKENVPDSLGRYQIPWLATSSGMLSRSLWRLTI